MGNSSNNNSTNIRDIIKEEIKIYLEHYEKCNKLNDLCEKISYILNDIKIDKNSLDKYYNILFENKENKLLINKLLSTIILLQNSNITNLRRKLTEVIPFHIMEKHRDYFSFTCDYFPNPSNLNELKKILSEKLQSETLGENEKDMINNDLKRLNVFINMKNQNTNSDFSVIIEENNIIGKK